MRELPGTGPPGKAGSPGHPDCADRRQGAGRDRVPAVGRCGAADPPALGRHRTKGAPGSNPECPRCRTRGADPRKLTSSHRPDAGASIPPRGIASRSHPPARLRAPAQATHQGTVSAAVCPVPLRAPCAPPSDRRLCLGRPAGTSSRPIGGREPGDRRSATGRQAEVARLPIRRESCEGSNPSPATTCTKAPGQSTGGLRVSSALSLRCRGRPASAVRIPRG